MLIELEGKQYKITISDTVAGIQLVGVRDAVVELAVHHQVPRHELMAYLQVHHARLQKEARKADRIDNPFLEMQLFDKKHIIKEDSKTKVPFRKGNILYVPALPKNTKQIDLLKIHILRDYLSEQIGSWEERLSFLLNQINLKSLRVHDYRLSRDDSAIAYAKSLAEVHTDMLDYIVASSVFDYLGLSTAQRSPLYEQYVKDWKYLAKVYTYERS